MRKTLLSIIALGSAACAAHPAPTEQIATSLAAVRGAEEAGAHNVPEADLQLELAQEQVAQAKQFLEQNDNLRAEDRAVRAENDAELALAIAHEDASKKRLEQFEQANQAAGGESPSP
jgi:hypothetical protein